jgi:hypothetical protein
VVALPSTADGGSVFEVERALGLDERHHAWLASLSDVRPPPRGDVLAHVRGDGWRALRGLGLASSDVAALLATLPAPDVHPARWWLLTRCAQQLIDDIGGIDYFETRWPPLPSALGLAGRMFYAHVLVALLPEVRRWHRRRGIGADVSRRSLADLARRLADHRLRRGMAGLDAPDWLTLHFRGALFELGRLQFHRSRIVPGIVGAGPLFWYDAPHAQKLGPGYRHGDVVLALHVPPTGPLDPHEVEASLRSARAFFARHFPKETYRAVVCTSWLLDGQLAEYLPATSNIIQFQRRFHLVPGALTSDSTVLEAVRARRPSGSDVTAPQTRLDNAVLTHLRVGNHWTIRTGWLEL